MSRFIASCIQTNSRDSLKENIHIIKGQIEQSAKFGAKLIALPENAFLMAVGSSFHQQVHAEQDHPALSECQEWAKLHKVWILIGSLAIHITQQTAAPSAPYVNRSYLIAPDGQIAARYDKIHLFDISIPGGESHRESKNFAHGHTATLANTPLASIGMSICYDVRFPYLYRSLAHAGAEVMTIPAAFTRYTGDKGGWHVLTRARAMETGSFVIAPAQCGSHAGDRKTYGHSLIINPWGDILAEAGETEEIIYAEIDLALQSETRQVMPSLMHDRQYKLKETLYDSMD